MTTRVAVVGLGRDRALGEQRRRESWEAMLHAAGFDVVHVALLGAHSLPGFRELLDLTDLARRRIAPESLSWSVRRLNAALQREAVDAAVLLTTRSFRRTIKSPGLVLDYVDRLSESYRARGMVMDGRARSAAFHLLGHWALRLERHPPLPAAAAGWSEAQALGVTWVPNVRPLPTLAPHDLEEPDHDLLFFGNLVYPPNTAALSWLAERWPELQRLRPGTTLLVAGRNADQVRLLAEPPMGWTTLGPFDDVARLCRRARVAVVPLEHASGIQNKVLEAAGAGLPQVVTEAAARGFGPGFVGVVAHLDGFMTEVAQLLDDPVLRAGLSVASRTWAARFEPEVWAPEVRALIESACAGDARVR